VTAKVILNNASDDNPTVDQLILSDLIDTAKLGSFQKTILFLCSLAVVLDGFDAQAIGFVAPAIKESWGIPSSVLGPVFSASLFGMVLGSLLLSPIADRFGRRPVLIGCVFMSGLVMLATGFATNLEQLIAMRFLTGICLGAIMPNALALTSEYSPIMQRNFLVMLMACGFSLGAAIGGVISAILIPLWGWDSVFFVGGFAPLLLGILMLYVLPESIQVMVLQNLDQKRIILILKKIAPSVVIGPNTRILIEDKKSTGVPVKQLFSDGRTGKTLLLWLMHFMNLADLYFLASWLPTVIRDSGVSMSTAVIAGSMLQIGSVLGAIVLGALISKFGFYKVLPVNYCIGASSIALIGYASHHTPLLFISIFIAGFCAIGGLNGINALAVSSYPNSLRTTGIGWALGVGRLGSISAPLLGGIFIGLKWQTDHLFLIAALPALVLLGALLVMSKLSSKRELVAKYI
jgi:AAHS family 4-hydroxybenzoate transporter-like MFS transporter